VLVEHVQELESGNVSRGIELEIHGPHLVGILSPVSPHRDVGGSGKLSLPGSGTLWSFLAPEPLDPLVINGPAPTPQQPVGHAPTPADVLSRDLPEAMAEIGLLQVDNFAAMALGAEVLAHNPAGQRLRSPVTLLQDRDGPAPAFQAEKFPSARSLSIAFCSSASAKSLHSFGEAFG